MALFLFLWYYFSMETVKKNEIYEVNIVDNGFKGEGIAKINDFTIFVPGLVKGEKARIKILKVNSSYAFGKVEELITPSEKRREIDCETYNMCGGCDMRHIDYNEILELKRNIVRSSFKKENLDVEIEETVGMDDPLFYRNKLIYPVGIGKDNRPVMGIYAERTHRIVDTTKCRIQNQKLQDVVNDIFSFIKQEGIKVYDETTLSGQIRHLVLRIGIKTNEVMVILVSNCETITKEKELVEYIVGKYPEVKTIVKNINKENTNVVLGNKNEILYGDGYIYDELLGFRFKISPNSFYQVNPVQTEKLYSLAIESAKLTGKETIFDLYCGIGTIGISASKKVKKIYGIETVPQAIEDAKENAKENGIENAEFFVGDVENKLPEFIKENKITPDVIFIDPPRKGCDKTALDTIIDIAPKRIIYVSCNPATLARDLKILQEKYEIQKVIPVDMFPFTGHIESIAILELQ